MGEYSHLSIFSPAKSAFVVEPDGTASMGLWFWLRCDQHSVWVRLVTDFTSNGQPIGYAKLINTGEVENGLFAYWLAAVLPTLPEGEYLNPAKEFINFQSFTAHIDSSDVLSQEMESRFVKAKLDACFAVFVGSEAMRSKFSARLIPFWISSRIKKAVNFFRKLMKGINVRI